MKQKNRDLKTDAEKKSWLHHVEIVLRHLIAKVLQGLAIFIIIGIPSLLLIALFMGSEMEFVTVWRRLFQENFMM